MAGGTWTTQNKTLPGVYTNIVGTGPNPSAISDRGIVALPVILPWVAEQEVMTLYPADLAQFVASYGEYSVPVREIMKNAKQLYFYRLNKGEKATATLGDLVCTAKYSGEYGNRFSVSIENVLGAEGKFAVITWLDTDEVDRQIVEGIGQLVDNDWIVFSEAEEPEPGPDPDPDPDPDPNPGPDPDPGPETDPQQAATPTTQRTLATNAGTPLAGGDNGTITNADYAAFLSAIETYSFNAIACTSNEPDVKSLFVAFVKRMVNDEGKYMQGVIPDIATADDESIISVKNGVYLEGGEHIPNTIAAAYIAGATASISLGASLTHANYDGAVDVDTRYTEQEQTELATTGQMVFIPSPVASNRVVIQKDINTLVTFDNKRTYAMSKNKVIRIVYDLATNIRNIGLSSFIGKTPNDQDGRSLLHAAILDYFRELEKQRALRDVQPEDIVVNPGAKLDAAVVDYTAKVVDVVEIIYNTIYVQG